jgi:outer membrane protein OmpA-like peptidoglycan-associated protein
MKTLIIGFLVLASWSTLSTYIYVCKIKGLCYERENTPITTLTVKDAFTSDTLPNSLAKKPVEVPENFIIHFDFDKYDLSETAIPDKYFVESSAFLGQNSQARLIITGHADATGSDGYNQALGIRRAESVLHYFTSKGISDNRILSESRGEKEPVDDNTTKEGRANNRRTVITIK